MTVYIEYVLIDNFFIDYILLKLSSAVLGKKIKKLRLIFCSILGALVALVYPLIKIEILSVLVKILTGFLITLVAHKYNSIKDYVSFLALFFAFTFSIGGGIIAIFSIFNIEYSKEIFIATMILPVYLLAKIIKDVISFIYKKKSVMQNLYDIELKCNGKIVKLKGFLDTGNGVYYNDKPVIFVTNKTAIKFLNSLKIPTILKINVNTINGEQQKKGILLDELRLFIDKKEHSIKGVVACVVDSVGTGYDAILHPDLIEGHYESVYQKISKVS